MKTSEFYTLATNAEMREARIDEILDAVDMVASGCTDDLSIVRLLNQYAQMLRMLSAGSDDQEQGEE